MRIKIEKTHRKDKRQYAQTNKKRSQIKYKQRKSVLSYIKCFNFSIFVNL